MSNITLVESTQTLTAMNDGSYEVVILTPGQGTSAFYTEEVVASYAPVAFPKGTHVYLDHLGEGEVRTTQKLVGRLITDTIIRESDGAAINRLKPYKHFAEFVEEIRADVGLSISAKGQGRKGIMNGRPTMIAETIDYSPTNTVDIVPWGGREGAGFNESLQSVLDGIEDDQSESSAPGETQEGNKMELSDEAVEALASAISTKIGTVLTEALAPAVVEVDESADRVATVKAIQAIESAEVPASVKTRLVEGVTNGTLIGDAVTAEIAAAVTLREEIEAEVKNKFEESLVIGATGVQSKTEAPKVSGWGA